MVGRPRPPDMDWSEFNPSFEGYVEYSTWPLPPYSIGWPSLVRPDSDQADEHAFYSAINVLVTGMVAAGPAFTFDTFGAWRISVSFRNYSMIARATPLLAIPAAAYLGTEVYMSVMTKYAPHEHHEQPSYWRAIAQAIGAGGVGVGTGADSYV